MVNLYETNNTLQNLDTAKLLEDITKVREYIESLEQTLLESQTKIDELMAFAKIMHSADFTGDAKEYLSKESDHKEYAIVDAVVDMLNAEDD